MIQKFEVEMDGEVKEASVLKIVELDEREYAIYSIDKDDDSSDVFASEIVKDEFGNDTLIDITEPKIKQNLIELVGIMLS